MRRQVVISGMGIICGIGKDKAEVFGSIKSGKTGIGKIRKFDVSMYDCQYGCEVSNYNERKYFDSSVLEYANLCTQFGLISLREALDQSKLDLSTVNPYDVGICVGSSHGALDVIYDYYRKISDDDYKEIDERYLFRKQHGSILKVIAHEFQINGMMSMISTACASGNNALGMAHDWIQSGKSKYVLVGGSDVLDQSLHAGFYGLKAVSSKASSPFSGKPGISLGEGAAFFIVENIESAKERQAPILSEILGYGLSGDAYHATSPDPSGRGVQLAMGRAVNDAGISHLDIDYVNAHGTGTDGNDAMEALAHVKFFGDRANQVPMSSTKSYFGHATGAAGSLETCVSIMCANEGLLPPTINFTTPRYKYPIDFIPNVIRHQKANIFMSSNYGFAGNNSVTILRKYNEKNKQLQKEFPKRSVAITGIGIVSPIAVGYEEFGKALQSGKNAVANISRFDTSAYTSSYACIVENFKPSRYNKQIAAERRMDLVSQYSVVAASLCLEDAGIPKRRKIRNDVGIVMCVSSAPKQGVHEHLTKMINKGPQFPSSIYFPYSTQNSSLGHVNITLGLMGSTSNLHVDGCSALNGLIYGQMLVESKRADRIIVGGGDEVFWSYYEELSLLKELNNNCQPITPFIGESNGYHPGEGAAFMMLEPLADAVQRKAKIYGELLGSGATIDSNAEMHHNDISGAGLIMAVEIALAEAGIEAGQIGWVGSTERGLPNVRQAELKTLKHFWGSHLDNIGLINTTPYIGWMDSVSPMMNLSAMIYSYRERKHAPSLCSLKGDKTPDTNGDYGLCLGVAREGFNYALITKLGDNDNVSYR